MLLCGTFRMRGVVFLVLLAVLPSLCVADLSTAPITTDWIPRVSRKMVKFAESQTGALQLAKAYDERLNFTEIQIDGVAQLHLLTQAAGDRLKKCREILERNKAEIEASHAQGPTGGAPASDCCDNLGQLEYDPRFLQQIVNDSCATFTAGTGDNTVRPHVFDTMKSNIHEMSGVTWQYYGAKEGEYHQFPKNDRSCEGNDHRFRNWYVGAASPKKKNVVIVMDVSGSMREPQAGPEEQNRLNLAKQAALTVLDTLTPRDWAGVVAFSARAEAPEGCLGDSLGEANPTNIGIMKDFINQRVPETITVYAEGFKKAFNMFFESKNKKPEQFENCQNIIIFLTDGQPTDIYFTLDDIVKGQDLMERSVHIFTYGLGANLQWANSGWYNDPSRPWVQLPALDFLATIADQNNRQIPGAVEWTNRYCENGMYGSCFSANRDPQGVGPWGRTEYIDDNEGDKLKTIMGSYYDFFPFSSDPAPTYSVPTNDEHLGLVINAALPTIDTAGTFFGVTAVDISMDIVFREIANFNIGKYSYAFLVDREDGRVLIHRNLPKPMEWRSEPTFLGLEAMESALRSRERTKILNGDSGDYYTMVKVPIARGNAQFDGAVTIEKAATFYYEPIPDTKYSVVLCHFEDDETIAIPAAVKQENTGDLYHRLDLLYMNNATGDTQFCSLYGEYATPDESTIKFPPEAFVDPVNYLGTSETFDDVVDIELFINDVVGFAANPGLLDGVRTDAILSAEIEQYWRENGQESLWRYFGTENGVFRIFPGIITDKRYDPTRQTWYARALSRPEDYTFSRPVPSLFGGGNMVTISRAILHTKTEQLLGVIAADITEKYFYSMLYSEVPECLSDEYDCFLLDDSGYFMESLDNTTTYYLSTFNNNIRDMEHDHLTHRFPWLAKTLIVRGEYLRAEWCNNYATQNAQLFYDTTGFIGLEVTTGPPCYQFALHPINSTNTFILTLHNRHTYNCDDRPITVGGNQNCSCNDICLTCSTEELQLCQCPCICDWYYDSCTNEIQRLLSDIPCPPSPKDLTTVGPGPPYPPGPEVEECGERCSAQSDNISCEALPHCVWQEEMDFPVCTENSIDMSAYFPCLFVPVNLNGTSQLQQDVADSFLSSLRAALQNRGFQVPEKVIHAVQVGRDTINFRIQSTMEYQNLTGLQSAIRDILSWDQEFTFDGFRSANPDDKLNNAVKFEISFEDQNGGDIDFDAVLESNFTLRDVLEQDIINFVIATLGPSSVATLNLDKIWIQSNCTFSISVPLDQVDAIGAEELQIVNNIGNFITHVGSLQIQAINYHTTESCAFCPPVCEPRDELACYQHTSCEWCVFEGAPHCGADCLLQEETKEELSVFFPCLPEVLDNQTEQQIQDSFQDEVLQLLRANFNGFNTSRNIFNVTIANRTVSFSLKSSMLQRITPEIISFLRNVSNWSGVTLRYNGNQYPVWDPNDYTDIKFFLRFDAAHNFTEILSHDFTERRRLEDAVRAMVNRSVSSSVLPAELAPTVANIWAKDHVIPFTINKDPARKDTNMAFIAAAFARSTIGVEISGRVVPPLDISYELGFYSICQYNCSTIPSQGECVAVPSCGWCTLNEGPGCGDDCYLVEWVDHFNFIPCDQTRDLTQGQIQQLVDRFRLEVAAIFGSTDKIIRNVAINDYGINFELQATMQDPFLPEYEEKIRDAFELAVDLSVGNVINPYLFRTRDPEDFTDMVVRMTFSNVDFGHLVSQHSVSGSALLPKLRTALTNAGISQQYVTSSRILERGQNYIEFSISKPVDSNDNLRMEVEKLVTVQNAGGILLNLKPAQGWPVSTGVSYRGTFDSICVPVPPQPQVATNNPSGGSNPGAISTTPPTNPSPAKPTSPGLVVITGSTIGPPPYTTTTGTSTLKPPFFDCAVQPAGLYPDPQDCTMYYQCSAGHPHPAHKPCPANLVFDWDLLVCNYASSCTNEPAVNSVAPPTEVTKVVTEIAVKPLSIESETAPTCTNEYMELALPAHRLSHVVTSGLHWDPDPSCKATFNGTHYILRTGLYECGTKVTFDTKYVIFYNNVSLLFTHDGVITRDPDVVIHSICKYERDEAVMSEFLPIPGGLEFVDEGFGQLSIRLDLFPTQSYLSPYTTLDYPVHKHLRDRMYLQLQVQGHARQLSVIALHCEATSGRNTSLQYPLIQDGCASDDTLQLYTTPDPATQRFSLEAFRFVQEVTTIHIRCEVEVCDAADTGSRCAQGCRANHHHKRALEEQDDMKSRFLISRGPIILDSDSQPEGDSKTTILLTGGSAVMITLAAVLVAVKVRRSKRVHPGYQQLINLDVE
ncbi:uncharacterized protein LOC118416038 isoform X3 [Branchiostoma floridae]|uniref:chitinase n=1 Tax=Branchiostoma floridae TaxID=7739 RepID=A0A9J7L7X1_BRAFL|nr:uncharacterized protein LOC118416038 isoform X3 [Branchiostoma floridae]